MRTFKDTRGRSWFDIVPEMVGQIDITANYPGTIRGFHSHDFKTEWFFAITGNFKLVLTDPDEIIYMSAGDCVRIEPGRWHGYQVLGIEESIMLEYSTHKHNLKNPDDKKKPYNAFDKWEKEKK